MASANPPSSPFARIVVLAAAAIEFGTGIALLADPALVLKLLLGTDAAADSLAIARLAGIALLALGVACWPSRSQFAAQGPGFRGLLLYNFLVVGLLAWLGARDHFGGALLWPAVGLHTIVTLLLLASRRGR